MACKGCSCLLTVLVCSLIFTNVGALLEGIYCGKENCYDVLGINRDAPKADVAKAYRKLAKQYHPDVHRTQEGKNEAESKFMQVATAYEILRDDDSRKDYDYMLDHPDEVYRNYFRYYRRQVAPRVDVRLVIAVTITIISLVQYLSAWQRYKSVIDYLMTVPKYRLKAFEIAKEEGLLDKKKRDRKSKEEQREEENAILRKIVQDKMDIKGGYEKPSYFNVLWVQLVIFPYTVIMYIWWYLKWIWKFNIKKEEYGQEEKLYLIRKYLGYSKTQFMSADDSVIQSYLKEELWIKDKFKVWKKKQEEELKVKLAQNARYKSYRRYMKNHGPGQITFDE